MEDVEAVKMHDVFSIDPIELQKFIGCYVYISLVGETNFSGIVYTIDPVSQSVVLITSGEESLSVKIILKHSILSMEMVPKDPIHLMNLNLNDLFGYKYNTPQSDINANKERVKLWLLKNLIEVEECGDLLKLDSLEIHPPYTVNNCICSNTIVLDRVQKLLRSMADETMS